MQRSSPRTSPRQSPRSAPNAVMGGFTLPGAIHTSGIYPSSRLSESYVGQCWTPDQGGVYRVAGSEKAEVRGAKLATTVAEGAILGPELVTNGGFDSDTWWTKNGTNTAITGGQAVVTNSDTSSNGVSRDTVITVGARYRITYTLVSISSGGFFPRIGSAANGTNRTTPGTYTEDIVCAGDTKLRLYGTVTGQSFKIDNVSLREIIPVFLAPDTYPTRSVRTRFGTARVPTGTTVGMVSSPAFTNDLTCKKTNPDVTTGWTADGGATISLVAKATELAAAGLSSMCSVGNIYKVVWTAAGTVKSVATCGDTNKRCCRMIAYVASVSGAAIKFGVEDSTLVDVTATSLTSISQLDITPGSSTKKFTLSKADGTGELYFIAPAYVKSSYLPSDPIVPLTAAADTAAPFTRAAVYAEHNTAGVFPTVTVVETLAIGHVDNPYTTQATRMSDGSVVPVVSGASWAQNFAVFGTCVPDAGGQTGSNIVASYIDANNTVRVVPEGSSGVSFYKRIAGSTLGPSSVYTYTANAPFDYLCLQTIHGMAIRIRPHATMTWSAWTTHVITNGKKPAPIGSKYQIGALNGASGIAGKHPKVSIFELGNQATLTAYQDRAMLLAGRITG